GLAVLAIIGSVAVVIWIPVYATIAFMRVYGKSVGSTLIRELGIGVLYVVVSVAALILTLYWVSVAT
ncbi:MAG TPA: hypothetical protein VJ865_07375, partial [Gemmatimonadaceae bacterium]|nr:hypothetical protein [Gemmatimonadaceae bacterium]